MCRGGIVQTRPGRKLVASLAGEKLQGMTVFSPRKSIPSMLVAIDGRIYQSAYPFDNFSLIEAIQFSSTAERIVFQTCTKNVQRQEDGSLALIPPYQLVVIQDGVSNAAFWDGTIGRQLDPSEPRFETKIGLWMSWSDSRLWIADGSRLYASDIADPLSFTETLYLAERSSFELPDIVTGMIQTSDQRGLLVFTSDTTTSIRSEIRNRTQWGVTQDFQRIVLPSLGCVAGKTAINHRGITHWMSKEGVTTLDAALYATRTAQIYNIDSRMMRSKRNLSADVSLACAFTFDSIMAVSVPSGDRLNAHTWIMDRSSSGDQGGTPAWCGVWTGTRPAEWASANIAGRTRAYCASTGVGTVDGKKMHIWEEFDQGREDNGGGIICFMETGAVAHERAMRFCYAEIEAVEILGDVNVEVYVRGNSGPWHQILDTSIQVEKGSIGSFQQPIIDITSILEAFKPQSRTIKTKEFNPTGKECSPETGATPGIDKCFYMAIKWRGRMGVRAIRMTVSETSEANRGRCEEGEAGSHNAVSDSGVTPSVEGFTYTPTVNPDDPEYSSFENL